MLAVMSPISGNCNTYADVIFSERSQPNMQPLFHATFSWAYSFHITHDYVYSLDIFRVSDKINIWIKL